MTAKTLYILQHVNGYVEGVYDSLSAANRALHQTDRNDWRKWNILERDLNNPTPICTMGVLRQSWQDYIDSQF